MLRHFSPRAKHRVHASIFAICLIVVRAATALASDEYSLSDSLERVVASATRLPTSQYQSASSTTLITTADIEAERYECVLVIGAEQERNVPGEIAARHLGAAAWVGH